MNIKKYCRLILLVFKGKSSVKKGAAAPFLFWNRNKLGYSGEE